MSNIEKHAFLFKALSDVNRLAVLRELQNGSLCACALGEKLDLAQPALSYHMKILCQTGLVNSQQKGKWKHYSLNLDFEKEIYRGLLSYL